MMVVFEKPRRLLPRTYSRLRFREFGQLFKS